MLEIQIFASVKEAEPAWRAAEAECIGYGFTSLTWLSEWQETVGTFERVKPYIVRVYDKAGTTVMLLPLGIRQFRGCSVLSFLGGELADYHAPILHPDFAHHVDDTGFEALWREILRQLPPFDLVYLTRLPQWMEGIENPFIRLTGARHTADSYFIVLEKSFADFQRGRRGDLRRDTGRKRRRLAEIGVVSFRIARTRPEIEGCMAALIQQRSVPGHDPSYIKAFRVPAHRAFYWKMALEHGSSGPIQVCALYVDEKIVATHWGMIYHNRFYWLMPGYERGRWTQYSPGRLLLEHLVEWCYANGIAVFDLTIGDEGYKRQWADHKMALFDLEQAQTAKGLALVVAHRALFAAKQWVKSQPALFALAERGLSALRRRTSSA